MIASLVAIAAAWILAGIPVAWVIARVIEARDREALDERHAEHTCNSLVD